MSSPEDQQLDSSVSENMQPTGEKTESNIPPYTLVNLEDDMLKAFARINEKANPSFYYYKEEIRRLCSKHAKQLGLPEELRKYAAMYYFIYLYQNPEAAHKLWEELFTLSELLKTGDAKDEKSSDRNNADKKNTEGNQPDANDIDDEKSTEGNKTDANNPDKNKIDEVKVFRTFNRIFQLNRVNQGGLTHMWNLIHAIVRGDIEIKTTLVQDKPIYFAQILADSERKKRNTNAKRQQIQTPLKQAVIDHISIKPLPNPPQEIFSKFNKQDQDLLRKIYIYLQEDADIIVESSEWRRIEVINKYLEQVKDFLIQSYGKIRIQQGKHVSRKERFAEFINHIINGYLKDLREYCLKMADDREDNRFSADALLEATFINANYVDVDEPSLGKIAGRWRTLVKDIENALNENATMWQIPIFKVPTPVPVIERSDQACDPQEFASADAGESSNRTLLRHPVLTGEFTPVHVPVFENGNAQAGTADPALESKPQPIETADTDLQIVATDPAIDAVTQNAARRASALKQTIFGVPQKEIDRPQKAAGPATPATQATSVAPAAPLDPIQDELHRYGAAVGKVDLVKKKATVAQSFARLMNDIMIMKLDLMTDAGAASLMGLLNSIVNGLETVQARIEFAIKCNEFFNETIIQSLPEKNLSTIYGIIHTVLFDRFDTKLSLPPELDEKSNLKLDPHEWTSHSKIFNNLMRRQSVHGFKRMPSLEDFPLLEDKIAEDNETLQSVKKYLALSTDYVLTFKYMEVLMEAIKPVEIGKDPVNKEKVLLQYFEKMKQEHDAVVQNVKKMRKKIEGGSLKKFFRSKARVDQLKQYFDELEASVEKVWNECLAPVLYFSGKILLGNESTAV